MTFRFTPPSTASAFISSPAFDGLSRTCIKFGRSKRDPRVKRCKKFRGGKGTPTCKGLKRKNLRSGRGPGGSHGCGKGRR